MFVTSLARLNVTVDHIGLQLTYLPKKYHEYIIPSLRRIYLDSPRFSDMKKDLKASKEKIKKLEKDRDVLMKQCEKHMAAARAQAEGERAARMKASDLQSRLDIMQKDLGVACDMAKKAIKILRNDLHVARAGHLDLEKTYDELRKRYPKSRQDQCLLRQEPKFHLQHLEHSMTSSSPLLLTVIYRGNPYALSLLPESTLSVLQAQLEELTQVPASLQKLLHKGKNLLASGPESWDQTTLAQAGFKNGMKVQMMGSTSQELTSMQTTEEEQRKRERILRERALKPQAKLINLKLRSTGTADSSMLNYRFHQLKPLDHLPNPASALALLTKLSEDPAIRHIMQIHKFSVGTLTELAPHEHPELLGLNVNAGQAIKLRLRTDRYDGFRLYREVRRVLCHELTHNVWGDHDNNFKELNSKLNREVADFERAAVNGTHYLSGNGDTYQPSSELEAEAQSYILGGMGSSSVGTASDESREERRRRVLEATMARLRKEDEELENSCGTGSAKT
ncbi:hypothetical protein C0992_009684 [Termitomyces sp. T32_za158]|nr:hypothetical protein C0992_009684 [Termitomyces sp. T32_za158]